MLHTGCKVSFKGGKRIIMMNDSFNMGFGGGFMWLFWILMVVAIVWWVLVIISGSKNKPSNRQKTALEILQERYAKSEINQQEFLKNKKDLNKS